QMHAHMASDRRPFSFARRCGRSFQMESARAANSVCSLPRLRGRVGEGVTEHMNRVPVELILLHAPSLSLPRKRAREWTEDAALTCFTYKRTCSSANAAPMPA